MSVWTDLVRLRGWPDVLGIALLWFAAVPLGAAPSVAAGAEHSVFVQADGSLWAWGANGAGQLGEGGKQDRSAPQRIATGYTSVACGQNYTLAIKRDGSLWAWGDNFWGQLGDGSNTARSSPVLIGSGYSQVATGGGHTLALRSDGALWAWGWNGNGQLGDGTTISRNAPVLIGHGFVRIAAGANHSLAIRKDGSLWAWGSNALVSGNLLGSSIRQCTGQLGDGGCSDQLRPVPVGAPFSQIAAGDNFSLAIRSDGSLWSWGANNFGTDGSRSGLLGDDSGLARNRPLKIGEGYSQVSARGEHAAAITTQGVLMAWGNNAEGAVGDGSNVDRGVPVVVGEGFVLVAAGYNHMLAIKRDGSLWAWGSNFAGALGTGADPAKVRYAPVQIWPQKSPP
ncbi:RCC1 domain-containing protein [Chitinimonas sp.]|uniref:RCC1 domain-containing protein n=1 Tax=Chitinimonas sp. TaxID=1934313 RepID=UPI0035B387C9